MTLDENCIFPTEILERNENLSECCDIWEFGITEQKTWMMIHHNNTELTRVQPGPGVDQHLVHFSYPSEEEQLLAAISQSQQCEQELSYRCRKSRLLNTPGKPLIYL